MGVSIRELVEKFPDLLALARGSNDTRVEGLKDASQAATNDLIFIFNAKGLKESATTAAKIWLVHKDLTDQTPASLTALLVSPNPQLAMARIAKNFFPQVQHHVPIQGEKIHPSAHISPNARLGENCIVGPGAVIGDRCEIGQGCIIGSNAVIEPDVKIGERTHIHPLVFIGHSCQIGKDCEIHPHTTIGTEGFGYAYDAAYKAERLTHYGRVILEDRVHIGAGVQIDRGTYLDSHIGADTKIDNHCHFAHNTVIGRNTIITGGMIAAGSSKIGSYCVIGGRTTIGGHLEIADKTKIGGLSGITKSIEEPGEYGGFPLQEIGESLKTRVALRNLPKMLRQIRRITKQLGLKTEE